MGSGGQGYTRLAVWPSFVREIISLISLGYSIIHSASQSASESASQLVTHDLHDDACGVRRTDRAPSFRMY